MPRSGVDDLALLWDSNVVSLEYGVIDFEVFGMFFTPIKHELAAQLRHQDSDLPRCRVDVERPKLIG